MAPDDPPTGNVHVLTDLPGWDPTLGDPGRTWHPHPDSPEWAPDGTLRDLTVTEVYDHTNKPEAEKQIDGYRRRVRTGGTLAPFAAEDSTTTDEGQV